MSLGEQAAYHDAFDVQTLAYRAPEVIYGQLVRVRVRVRVSPNPNPDLRDVVHEELGVREEDRLGHLVVGVGVGVGVAVGVG